LRPRSQPEARRLPPIVGHRRERRDRLYPAVLALVVANTLNAGADIGAIAAAINLLVPIPAFVVIVPSSMVVVAGL
jgi:hypothetical protein